MDSKALAPAPASGEPADDGSASLECKPRKRAVPRPVGPVESSSDVSSSDDDGDASDGTSGTSAIEHALGLREIRTTVGDCLALPDLAAFACVSRQYPDTFRARLTAPCDLERLWALPDPFAIKEEREYIEIPWYAGRTRTVIAVNPNGTTLLTDLFGYEARFLHRARAKTIEWAGGALRQYGSLGRRVHPRLSRGFEADDDRVAGDNDEPTGGPARFLHNVATASVDGAPGVVLHLNLVYYCVEDLIDSSTGEEIWARLSFSADGGAPRVLCFRGQSRCSARNYGRLEHLPDGADSYGDFYSDGYSLLDVDIWGPSLGGAERSIDGTVLTTNRQDFARRFALNDPMRTCDMDHALDSFLSLAAQDWLRGPPGEHPRDQWDDWWNEALIQGETPTGPWGPIRV